MSSTCVIFDCSLIKQCFFVTSASWFAFVYFSICLLALNAFYAVLFSCLFGILKNFNYNSFILLRLCVFLILFFCRFECCVLSALRNLRYYIIVSYVFVVCRKQPIITILNNHVFLLIFCFIFVF